MKLNIKEAIDLAIQLKNKDEKGMSGDILKVVAEQIAIDRIHMDKTKRVGITKDFEKIYLFETALGMFLGDKLCKFDSDGKMISIFASKFEGEKKEIAEQMLYLIKDRGTDIPLNINPPQQATMIDNEINALTAEYKQDKSKKDANKAKIYELQNTKKNLYERAGRDKENLIEVVKEFEEYVKDLFFEYDFSTVEYDYKFNLLLQDTLLSLGCQIKKPE